MFGFLVQRPYLHLCAALALGILAGQRWPLPLPLLALDQPLLWLCIAALAGIWWIWREHPSWAAYLPGLAVLAVAGYVTASLAIRLPLSSPLIAAADGRRRTLYGRVASIPKYQRGHLRFMLDVSGVDAPGHAPLGLCYVFVKALPETALDYTERVAVRAGMDAPPTALNYGEFDYAAYLLQRGAAVTAYATSPRAITHLEPARLPWGEFSALRRTLIRNMRAMLPPDMAELAVSVVYGDKITELPGETEERFRRAGLTHILVASGTQVSLLILLLASLFCRVRQDFTLRSTLFNLGQFALTLSIVLLYAAVTGFETSIARALVMGVLVMVGKLLHRDADGLTSLTQSALILLLLNPLALSSPGFLLSFGATLGLIYGAGVGFPLVAHLRRWPRTLMQMLITTGGAQLFVAPVIAAQFQQVSLWGLLSNMVAIPTAFGLLIVGGAGSLGLGVVPLLGPLLGGAVHALCWLLDGGARLFAALPGSSVAVPQPPWWWILAFYALILLAGEFVKARQSVTAVWLRVAPAALVALSVLLAAWVLHWVLVPQPELSVLALPHGEAYIWRTFCGRTVLLLRSAGLERGHNADTVESALRYAGVNRLHGIVWIDAPPPAAALKSYAAPAVLAGGGVPGAWDMGWLAANGHVGGACLGFGGRKLWLIWDGECAQSIAPGAVAGAAGGAPAMVVFGATAWDALPRRQRDDWEADCSVAVGGLPDWASARGRRPLLATQLRVLPGRHGVVLRRYTPWLSTAPAGRPAS